MGVLYLSSAHYAEWGGENIYFCFKLKLTFCYDSRCRKQVIE